MNTLKYSQEDTLIGEAFLYQLSARSFIKTAEWALSSSVKSLHHINTLDETTMDDVAPLSYFSVSVVNSSLAIQLLLKAIKRRMYEEDHLKIHELNKLFADLKAPEKKLLAKNLKMTVQELEEHLEEYANVFVNTRYCKIQSVDAELLIKIAKIFDASLGLHSQKIELQP